MSSSKSNAAVEAIKFAINADEGIEFLRVWLHGEFDVIRKEWPEAPESVFVSAEQKYQNKYHVTHAVQTMADLEKSGV